MNHINITNKDVVKCMSNEQKHILATQCTLNNIEPKEIIEPIKNIANSTINFAIDICNSYFKTPEGRKYLENRAKIEKLGE